MWNHLYVNHIREGRIFYSSRFVSSLDISRLFWGSSIQSSEVSFPFSLFNESCFVSFIWTLIYSNVFVISTLNNTQESKHIHVARRSTRTSVPCLSFLRLWTEPYNFVLSELTFPPTINFMIKRRLQITRSEMKVQLYCTIAIWSDQIWKLSFSNANANDRDITGKLSRHPRLFFFRWHFDRWWIIVNRESIHVLEISLFLISERLSETNFTTRNEHLRPPMDEWGGRGELIIFWRLLSQS